MSKLSDRMDALEKYVKECIESISNLCDNRAMHQNIAISKYHDDLKNLVVDSDKIFEEYEKAKLFLFNYNRMKESIILDLSNLRHDFLECKKKIGKVYRTVSAKTKSKKIKKVKSKPKRKKS